MRPTFHPRLINPPFGDPGIYVPFLHENRALIFDLGDTGPLTSKDLLKVSHVFISHTHMDHFMGLDRLVRLFLGRGRPLHLYGPGGFIDNVRGKLSAYSWNLAANYSEPFDIHVTEVLPDHIKTTLLSCENRFIPRAGPVKKDFHPVLHKEPGLSVSCAILDHGIDCLGFCLEERFHVNIRKERLQALGLEPGPWINGFKQALCRGADSRTLVTPLQKHPEKAPVSFSLEDLAHRIALITRGQKIAYVADAGFTPENREKIVALATGADQLFIEAAFLDPDAEMARNKHHLTARQAGILARGAGAKTYSLFHFSPRYEALGEAAFFKEASAGNEQERAGNQYCIKSTR